MKKSCFCCVEASLFVYVDLHFSGINTISKFTCVIWKQYSLYCGKPSPSAMADTFS